MTTIVGVDEAEQQLREIDDWWHANRASKRRRSSSMNSSDEPEIIAKNDERDGQAQRGAP